MILPGHLLTGIVLSRATVPGWRRWLLVPPLAIVSHAFLDAFNAGKYIDIYHGHPANPQGYLYVAAFALATAAVFWVGRRHWWGMLWAWAVPDLDHLIPATWYGQEPLYGHAIGWLHYGGWQKIFMPWLGEPWGLLFIFGVILLGVIAMSDGGSR